MIDSTPVVRLKEGLAVKPPPDPFHWGTRTDYVAAHSRLYQQPGQNFWCFRDDDPEGQKWLAYYKEFKPRKPKPSTGLMAVFMAIDKLKPKEIAVIGFDRVLDPTDGTTTKWHKPRGHYAWGHDQRVEHLALMNCGTTIIDLVKEHAKVP